MLSVLHINVTANWGSTGKIAEAIGHKAMSNGWRSFVAYGRMANHSSSELIKIGTNVDPYLHYLSDRLFDREGLGSRRSTKNLIRRIESIKPDIVHLHNIHDHYLNYQVLFDYLNSTDIKVVWTFHDCWAFTGHCYHFVHVDCMKWTEQCSDCIQRHKFVDRSRENYLLKKSLFTACKNLTIVPCSEWMGNFVKKSFFKDKQIRVIHNGVDLNHFKVIPECRLHDNKYRILAVSNVWTHSKGIDDIYRLRSLLHEDFVIIVVGLSVDQIKSLPVGIEGISRTQDVNELVKLYNNSEVLINPTYADTFPTVNLEALACGTPVITYRTGGSPEAIDERTGVVVDQGDVKSLAQAIINLRKNPLSRKDCRDRAEEYFDKDKCFKKYIELYDSLLAE